MNEELYCCKHPERKAVAILNKKYPMCQECTTESQVEILNSGEMLGIAYRGEPQALIIPKKVENEG